MTVITRLARSGVPEAKAMKFVGHASTEIHRIYQRLSVDDLACCHDPLQLPAIQTTKSEDTSAANLIERIQTAVLR